MINDIWDPSRSYSFVVTDATIDTQIKFLGNDYELKGVGKDKNRIFQDDIKVKTVNHEELFITSLIVFKVNK